MPVATLTYQLPEETEEYTNAMEGAQYKRVLEEALEYIRGQLKYNSDNLEEAQLDAIRNIRTYILNEISERGLTI